ncbi:hypothetical protein AYL99_04499 [Fonsecaea erecta]|uniref:Uncharacterized protein n=1 Tax=Fonsecaea erecta TaxID=1367422 RepID=A0A178ZSD2_9EURO|nr:hypothetical protein AYL99_04499 [Fonsecaea erecta]OAP62296.1 hypothetical protein AYL99_04499 [Fonsecaea erecta]
MCITEIWSYRECGCFYNHKTLCRSYRRGQTPCCAPNIQHRVDTWLDETAGAPETCRPQLAPRAICLEPGDCPNHRVVEKSFLNQICEDCLLAELDGLPSSLGKDASARDVPNADLDNREGLIWDSEVKVEIEDSNSEPSASQSAAEASVHSREAVDEDRMILESHVEITIEDEHHNIVTKSPASPEQIAHQRSGRSQLSLIQPSSSNSLHDNLCITNSRPSGSKRYGRAFQGVNVAGFDHAYPDDGINLQSLHPSPQPLFRGRSLMCSNLPRTQVRKADAGSTPKPSKERTGIKGLAKFQSLKNLSMSFRVAPRSLMVDSAQRGNSGTGPACPSSSLQSDSKDLFRWKGSPPIGGTSESVFGSSEQLSDKIHDSIPNPEAQDTPIIPPRKSSLKNYLMQDFTRTRAMVQPRSGSRFRSLTPSPTSWLRKHAEPIEEIDSSTQGSVTHSETTFESASGASSLETTGAGGIKAEKAFLIPSIPKSSTMNTMRAIIDGYIDQDEAGRQPPLSREGAGPQGWWTGGTEM